MRPRHQLLSGLLLLFAMAATLCRTVRAPNDWAEAHWLLDYRFGFVKRGLPGQLLTWATDLLSVPITADVVNGVASTLLALFVAVMAALVFRIVRRHAGSPTSVVAMVAFLTSPFVVMTGHLNGYYDNVAFLLGVLSIWLALRGRLLPGAVLQAIALLAHEGCILLIYPAFVLACLVRSGGDPARQRPALRRPALLVPLLVPALMAIVMAIVLSTPPAGFEAGYSARLRAAGFVGGGMEENTPKMLAFSLWTMWLLVSHFFVEHLGRHATAFALVLPTLVTLGLLAGQHPLSGRRRNTVLAVATVALLPLSMHAIAWDIDRIWTYAIFTAFLAVWVLAEVHTGEPPAWPTSRRVLLPVAAVAIVANLVFVIPLLDFAADRLHLGVRLGILAGLLAGSLALRRDT